RVVTHGAADRAAAKQSALWPAQRFHVLDIEQIELGRHRRRIVNVVHIDADARLEGKVEIRLPDAPDKVGLGVPEGLLGGSCHGVWRRERDIRSTRKS